MYSTCVSIDVAIPGDRNAIKKENQKILKCKDFITEIQHMWKVKDKVIYRNWNRFRLTQTVPEQHTGKARN